MLATEHPNVALLKGLDFHNLDGSADLFAGNFVWHFFNPRLPDLEGDHVGLSGLRTFFDKLRALTAGTFAVEPISVAPFGDELVVMHTKNRMTLRGMAIETDVVVVWRIVDGKVAEVWDIPSVHAGPVQPHAKTQ